NGARVVALGSRVTGESRLCGLRESARTSGTTEADRDAARCPTARRQRAADVDAAGTTATANALRCDGIRLRTERPDITDDRDFSLTACASAAARTAEAHRHGTTRSTRDVHNARHVESAVTAAAAHALREHAARFFTARADIARDMQLRALST